MLFFLMTLTSAMLEVHVYGNNHYQTGVKWAKWKHGNKDKK